MIVERVIVVPRFCVRCRHAIAKTQKAGMLSPAFVNACNETYQERNGRY